MKITITTAIQYLTDTDDYVLVTWNDCYGGGPRLSDQGNNKLAQLRREHPETKKDILLLILLLQEDPKDIHKFSSYGLGLVLRKYREYISMREYDGLEDPYFDSSAFVHTKMKEHWNLNLTMSKEQYEAIIDESEKMNIMYIDNYVKASEILENPLQI